MDQRLSCDRKVCMRKNKRLTTEEFEVIRPHLARMKNRNVEAIKAILVEGRAQKDVAAELDVSAVAVSSMVRSAWGYHITHGARPEGWVSVSVVLPQEMAQLVREMERNARENLKAKK
jgi:FixJ family two-component response regulator